MKRFRRHGQESHRDRIKQELYGFNKTVEHGFPHQPSALVFSPSLQLLAIGTRSGAIKLYGAPGVEFMGLHDENAAVTQVHFLPQQVAMVTLLDDNSLHMWTLRAHHGVSELLETGRFTLTGPPGAPPSVTRVTAVLTHSSGDMLFLGTEGGHVFVVEVPGFRELEERNISLENVTNSLPEDYGGRRSLEHVESLQENPVNPRQVLIGYGRGIMVIWDLERHSAVKHIPATQQLESVWWTEDGGHVLSSHSDGSYCRWMVAGEGTQSEPEKSEVPYGHFPCKAISKIIQLPTEQGPPFLFLSGGMPRASYGDRHCISVIHSKTHVALDFTSRIIDFFVIRDGPDHTGDPSALVVLVEEELVVIDLQTEGWPVIQTPYLVPLHCSAITCSHHVSAIPLKMWERVLSAGALQNTHYSKKPWPITGGQNLSPDAPQRDLLLTGHEDGTVRFWDASGVCLYPMYKLSTAGVFLTDAEPNDNMNQCTEGEWPPFRKVGCFDPYSDDPRLGVQKIHLCKYSGYLTVAGTAGQILVLELNDEAADQMVEATVADLLQGQESFRWKGHTRLEVREEPVTFPPGFQPFALVQCQPPAVVTALTLHSEWKLVTFGTSHGFGLYDYQQKSNVLVRCTLNPSDQLAMEGPLSRVKSIKKSLRQSFRRIRRSRVSLRKHHVNSAAKVQEANARLEAELAEMELAPVQRKIEARSSDDSFTGLVRTLYFADTFLSDSSHHMPSLWAGTNGGSVFAYQLRLPPVERRSEDPVSAHPAKEIQLMHRAPVVGIVVLDGHGSPLPEPLEVAHDLARSADMQGCHQLLVISEEQFKVFTLPKVSAKMKLKLTAIDGSRVRRVGVAWFGSSRSEDYGESGLTVLTNQGDLHVVSLPGVKLQVQYPCIRREDVSGIASCVFTKHGQGFYLISPSEFERFSLSARCVVEPRSLVEVPSQTPGTTLPRAQPDGPSLAHRNSTRDTDDVESSARRVMEHALLNDETVLQEIQKSLEGYQPTFLENNVKSALAGGKVLTNGD
ncbi:LLGL scribble cell polarity complex component 2-like isoform X1 [Oncorhynchus keta]|uniref:LLGL scribble cell polarity complex component 2-like isoform X1 n=1 Tax=Oncorhynchus keta TaxID=8018 RepID=UPI00227AD5DF|nr:LLGL scribble cell polarity complex component 2-like isoform X1 [Oncorhynchus keta]XP_052349072.1 LLGL scribble cell polarity complex component 2-like isoform X1 [Oncorhynchus keta]XP_052349080.1 LLGL scribble cell polarity complex component 2-like isoform X1 [Oncorhynchus keta]